jgi:hypothetical protein
MGVSGHFGVISRPHGANVRCRSTADTREPKNTNATKATGHRHYRSTYEPCGAPKPTLVAQAGSSTAASGVFMRFIGTGPPSVLNFPSFPNGEFKNRGALPSLLLG